MATRSFDQKEVGRINGRRNSLTLATIPESDSSFKSTKRNSPEDVARAPSPTCAPRVSPRVQVEQLRTIILDVLTSYLAQFSEYNQNLFGRLGPSLGELSSLKFVSRKNPARHTRGTKSCPKYIMARSSEDGIDAATQCLWTPCCDKFATLSYGTKRLFAVGIVFAVQL